MIHTKKIKTALISVFCKDNLDKIVHLLNDFNVKIISTGGTQKYIENLGIEVTAVESLSTFPSILGGRVKTLHPKIFGGILARQDNENDKKQLEEYEIPTIDLVIVDLYPFEETLKNTTEEEEIIEKIDIGGISLIRAGAKNFKDVLTVSSRNQYGELINLLKENKAHSTLKDRKIFSAEAFNISSHYDTAIFNYLNEDETTHFFKASIYNSKTLRYGENPHQKGTFFVQLDEILKQIHGKEISYNNLLDIDASVNLIADFDELTFAILKHNNACGLASRDNLLDAWKDALAGDPISAFGGVLITNTKVDVVTAQEINKLFFEVIIAPSFEEEALNILKKKKNRIILLHKVQELPKKQFRTILNGVIMQDKDISCEKAENFKKVTKKSPSGTEIEDLIFANKIVKHTKSNTIVLSKNKQLISSGVGQTSRVDALKQAIVKAKEFNFNLENSVMASDAFFPFPDSVEIAHKEGINAVVQPGGSIKDKLSIAYCDEHDMSMVMTGIRHFKH